MEGVGRRAHEFAASFRETRYAVFVLIILMLTYTLNQLHSFSLIATNTKMAQEIKYGDRSCEPVVTNFVVNAELKNYTFNATMEENYCKAEKGRCDQYRSWRNETVCGWKYLGTGFSYQLLAGPLYIVFYSISGIPMAIVSELQNINRKLVLVICVLLWSLMTLLGGFVTQYWHVAICRLLLGIFSAGCVPFSGSLISDYFPQSKRGAALGFYNWGVYLGYSLSFAMIIVEREVGWRYVYFIVGGPGILMGLIIVFAVKEPKRGRFSDFDKTEKDNQPGKMVHMAMKLKRAALTFINPVLLILSIGGAIRNGAGIVWAYNIRNFFAIYHPGTQIELWNTWIPLIFGSIGAIGGGALSDKLSASRGTIGRFIILIVCLVLSAPCHAATLFLPMPAAFLMQIPAYIIGEMWIGVCIAVVLDIVPKDLTASSIAVYFFIIQIIGGNMNLFVTPIREKLEMRIALLITFPGMCIVAAVLFLVTLLLYKYYKSNSNISHQPVAQQDDELHGEYELKDA